MNPLTAIFIFLIASPFFNIQSPQSLETQAITSARQVLASTLDSNLPQRSFGEWFERVIGPGNQIVWQLSECGDNATTSIKPDDPRACVEADTILRDGRKVILMIVVGTFKNGVAGQPIFQFGVIEQKGELRPIRRLSDLPNLLSSRVKPLASLAVSLPELYVVSVAPTQYEHNIPLIGSSLDFGQFTQIDEVPSPPPSQSKNNFITKPIQQVSDAVLEGNAITRPEAEYPPQARALKAFGMVKVQITISETGRVIEAKAISGHNALRPAAIAAAKAWVFRPTTVDGTPIKVQGVLIFNFNSKP